MLALLAKRTVTDAAKTAGIDESTLRRWLADDDFKADYAAARQTVFEAGMDRVQMLVGRAVDTLAALMDKQDHPTVQLGAARTIVELGIHEHDAEAILKRLDELDAAQQRRRI